MNLLHLLIFKGSRKVGFGLWLFAVVNVYLVKHLVTSEQWFTTICLCSALIGGGTVLDRFIEAKKPNPPQA